MRGGCQRRVGGEFATADLFLHLIWVVFDFIHGILFKLSFTLKLSLSTKSVVWKLSG